MSGSSIATANVKGGLFGDSAGLLTLPSISGKSFNRTFAAKLLQTKSMLALRQTLSVLDGAVAGSNVTKTFPQVEANSELGGKRNITTQTLINRNSTANDVTETRADLLTLTTRTSFGANPVANKDGNPLGTR
jgi:hypothetical protein